MSTKLSIIVGVCGRPEIFRQFVDTTLKNCKSTRELVVVVNGTSGEEFEAMKDYAIQALPEWRLVWDLKFTSAPIGTIKPLNYGVTLSSGEYLVFPHTDMLVRTNGWDNQLCDFLDSTPRAGLVGITGAKIIGSRDIYQVPYEIRQLRRFNVWSSLVDWHSHTWMTNGGGHAVQPTPVVVLDGQFMACRRSDYNDFGPLDEAYVHHMYDNDLSLRFYYAGKTNYVLPIEGEHLSGQTANYPRYQEWAKTQVDGGDATIHKVAHDRFYAKWRGRLPALVRS